MVKIVKNRPASEAEWAEIYNHCDYATYFHSVEFSKLMIAYTPQIKIATRLIEFSDDKKAIFILFKHTAFKGLLTSHTSSIFGVYGGWISGDDLTTEHDDLLVGWIQKLNLFMRVNPYQRKFYDKIHTQPETTLRLSLQTDYESIHKNYEYRHKHAIKKAIEKGVTVRKAKTIGEWKEYYEVYLDSIRRWGDKTRSVYKCELFESFFNNKSGNIVLHTAIFENRIVAGAICFHSKKKVLYWHGSYLEEFKNVNPATYLIAEIIKSAVGRNDYFDFLPSANLKGVMFFKSGYRPDEVSAPTLTNYTLKYKVLHGALGFSSKVYQKTINLFR